MHLGGTVPQVNCAPQTVTLGNLHLVGTVPLGNVHLRGTLGNFHLRGTVPLGNVNLKETVSLG